MGKLHAIGSLEVRVFGRDHRPAHLHVLHPDGDALVDLFSLGVSRGTLPRQHRQEVMSRAILNRATLLAGWNRLDPDLPI